MKRLSKLIAVAAAMIMVMAMSVSAFAAESPIITDVSDIKGDLGGEIKGITNADVIKVLGDDEDTIEKRLPTLLEDEFEGVVDVPAGADVELLAAMDIPGGKDVPTIFFTVQGDYDYVYVLHYTKDGKWELWEKTPDANGVIKVTFDNGLSPVYLFAVMQGDKAISIIADGYVGPDGKVSHKTGF